MELIFEPCLYGWIRCSFERGLKRCNGGALVRWEERDGSSLSGLLKSFDGCFQMVHVFLLVLICIISMKVWHFKLATN